MYAFLHYISIRYMCVYISVDLLYKYTCPYMSLFEFTVSPMGNGKATSHRVSSRELAIQIARDATGLCKARWLWGGAAGAHEVSPTRRGIAFLYIFLVLIMEK